MSTFHWISTMHQALDWDLYPQYMTYSFPKAWGRYDDFRSTRWRNSVLRGWITCLESHSQCAGPDPRAHSEAGVCSYQHVALTLKMPWTLRKRRVRLLIDYIISWPPSYNGSRQIGGEILVFNCGSQCFSEMTEKEGHLKTSIGVPTTLIPEFTS